MDKKEGDTKMFTEVNQLLLTDKKGEMWRADNEQDFKPTLPFLVVFFLLFFVLSDFSQI